MDKLLRIGNVAEFYEMKSRKGQNSRKLIWLKYLSTKKEI